MRIGFGLIASLFVLTGPAAYLSARPTGTSKILAPPKTAVTGALPRPGAAMQSTPVAGVAELKISQCKELGGEVRYEPVGVCKTGFYCRAIDNNGGMHQVCIDDLMP